LIRRHRFRFPEKLGYPAVVIFTCALCGIEFESDGPEAEAQAEAVEVFGAYDPEEDAVVCDDCWVRIDPRQFPTA
jgi:hypothetical protein